MDSSVAAMWTSSDSIAEEMPRVRYCFPHFVMHEFGHALGLHDLYKFNGYGNYVRGGNAQDRAYTDVPGTDERYLEEVYQGHSPHR